MEQVINNNNIVVNQVNAVEMTAEELQELLQFRAEKSKKEAEQKLKEDKKTYDTIVDWACETAASRLCEMKKIIGI